MTTLEITVHKSHLVTIGERLYSEGFELLRELVNNAYDADATEQTVARCVLLTSTLSAAYSSI